MWSGRAGGCSRSLTRQWRDAFRAGGYTPEQARRYITKIKAKVHEGLALDSRPSKTARVDP